MVTTVPRPPHCGQIWLREKRPWLSWRVPEPPQRGQVTGWVPGAAPVPEQVWQRTSVVRLTEVVTPLTASSNERCSSVSTSAPRCGAGRPATPPAAAEQAAEQVAEVAHVLDPVGATAAGPAEAAGEPATEAAGGRAHGPDLVVLLAPVGVAEDVVGRARSP